jgi:hypothetical protein
MLTYKRLLTDLLRTCGLCGVTDTEFFDGLIFRLGAFSGLLRLGVNFIRGLCFASVTLGIVSTGL